MKKTRKYKIVIGILLLIILNIILNKSIYASNNNSIKAPSNIRAYGQSNTSIRIKWKALTNVDGYMVCNGAKIKQEESIFRFVFK